MPSYDGTYENIAYTTTYRIAANGVKTISLGAALNRSSYTFLPGEANIGASTVTLYAPMESIATYDPLSYTNVYENTYWGSTVSSDNLVELSDGTYGITAYSTYTEKRSSGLYLLTCARLGFYSSTSSYIAIPYTGRFSSVADGNSSTASSRPAAVSYGYDEEGNFTASVYLTDDDGNYYIPDGGTGTFKNIGSTTDIDYEDFLSNGLGYVSKKALSHSQVSNIVNSAYSSTTTVTTYTEVAGTVTPSNPYTYYLDYDGNYLRTYNEDDLEGNLYARQEDGSADYILLTGDNVVTHYDNGDSWLDWAFAYEWMDPNAWRYVSSTGTYHYYGYNAGKIYVALTGTAVPAYDTSTSFSIVSLDLTVTNGKVSHVEALTSTLSGASTSGTQYIYCKTEIEIEDTVREIDAPVAFERDDSYESVKAAFDKNNDMSNTFQTCTIENFSGMRDTALHHYVTYNSQVVLHDEVLTQSSTTREEIYGYYLRENVGIIQFEMDATSGEVTAVAPAVEATDLSDYWGFITASPDIMTWNSARTGFELKGNVHLLPSYFPTISGEDSGEEDSVTDLTITMGDNDQIESIDYMAGADFGSYGSANLEGTIQYDWDATLPEGLLTKLEAMEEFIAPTSWSGCVSYSRMSTYMNSFLAALNSETGESYTVDDLPYLYNSYLENYGSYAFSSYYSSYSGYFYISSYNSDDPSGYIASYIEMLEGLGYTTYTGSRYTYYVLGDFYIRPYTSGSTMYIYFYLPSKVS